MMVDSQVVVGVEGMGVAMEAVSAATKDVVNMIQTREEATSHVAKRGTKGNIVVVVVVAVLTRRGWTTFKMGAVQAVMPDWMLV